MEFFSQAEERDLIALMRAGCRCGLTRELWDSSANRYTDQHLEQVEVRADGWETLWRCPNTGAEWIEDHPLGAMQGGGPLRLRRVTPADQGDDQLLAAQDLIAAAIALVGAAGGEFPSDDDGLGELLERARRTLAGGARPVRVELLDEAARAAPHQGRGEGPDVWASLASEGGLQLMAVIRAGIYLSAEIRPEGTLVSLGHGSLGRR